MNYKEERKERIREQYKNARSLIEKRNLEIRPITVTPKSVDSKEMKRVCAYARVSTDSDNQTTSFELQKEAYKKLIEEHENWIFVDLFSDEGITGTNIRKRKGFQKMIEACKRGEIDLIITKSVARFARNVLDSLSVQQELSQLNPPVGVYFEAEHLDSLDPANKMILLMLFMVAEHESQTKSEIMNWSIDKRYELGLFIIPKLLGYELNSDGQMEIVEEEADIVRLCFYLFLNGFSAKAIALIFQDLEFSRKDCLKYEWKETTIKGILTNEKYCGEFCARKTYTPNYQDHIAKKNNGNRVQYYERNHHTPIVSPEIYHAALKLIEAHRFTSSGYTIPLLRVVSKGSFHGYIPIDRHWNGFLAQNYFDACNTVPEHKKRSKKATVFPKDLNDFAEVNQYCFSEKSDMYLSISQEQISFNTPCMEQMPVEHVCMYLHPVHRRIAILKANDFGRNFQWARYDGEWNPLPKSIKGFAKVLFEIMDWDIKKRYRIRGKRVARGNHIALIFDLSTTYGLEMTNVPIKEGDYEGEEFILEYRDCSDIACVLSQDALSELEKQIKEHKIDGYIKHGKFSGN